MVFSIVLGFSEYVSHMFRFLEVFLVFFEVFQDGQLHQLRREHADLEAQAARLKSEVGRFIYR